MNNNLAREAQSPPPKSMRISWERANSIAKCFDLLTGNAKKVELEDLDLTFTEYSEDLVSALSSNHECTSLSFQRTAFVDELLHSLGRALTLNATLRVLFFKNCALSDVHLRCLTPGLLINNTIVDLQLWDNNLTETSGELLGNILSKNQSLKRLNVNYNTLGDAGNEYSLLLPLLIY